MKQVKNNSSNSNDDNHNDSRRRHWLAVKSTDSGSQISGFKSQPFYVLAV